MKRLFLFALAIIAGITLISNDAYSVAPGAFIRWTNGGVNATSSPYSEYLNNQMTAYTLKNMNITDDGMGGVILTWMTNVDGYSQVFIQRFDCEGYPMWNDKSLGVQVANASAEGTYGGLYPQCISDGAGGAYVSYVLYDYVAQRYYQYMQYVSSNGLTMWGDAGFRLTPAGESSALPYAIVQMDKDGLGGVVVTYYSWLDQNSSITGTLRAAEINNFGGSTNFVWGPVVLGNYSSGNENFYNNQGVVPVIAADKNAGGALIGWETINGSTYYKNIAKINPSGTIAFNSHVSSSSYESDCLNGFQIVSDGTGGAILSYSVLYNRSTRRYFQTWALDVTSQGHVHWGPTLFHNSSDEYQYKGRMAADGIGGSYLVHYEGDHHDAEQLERIDSNGSLRFNGFNSPSGINLTGSGSHPYTGKYAQVVNDGAGNAICTWMQSNGSVYVAKYSRSSGSLLWGNPISLTTNGNTNDTTGLYGSPELASDGVGGAFVAWSDNGNNIYLQHVVDINMRPVAYFQLGGIVGDNIDNLVLPVVNAGFARVGDIVNISEFGRISNIGGQFPLQISRVTSSQGYASLSAPVLPISINNEYSVWLNMRVSFYKAGVFSDTLSVYTNDPTACPIKIVVTGQAFTKFPMLSVQDTIQFGDHGIGYLFKRTLLLRNVGKDTLHITGAFFPADDVAFMVIGNPVQAIPPEGSGAIIIGYEPTSLSENDAILIITSDDPRYIDPPKAVEVFGNGVAPMVNMLMADQINAGNIKVNTRDTVTFAITSDPNGATIPLIIKQLQLQGELSGSFRILSPVTFPDTFAYGETQHVRIEFSPAIGTSIGAYLHCLSNASEYPYDIPIYGVGLRSYLSTTSMNYGDVALNTCKTLSLQLTNSGNYGLNVISFELLGIAANRFTTMDNPLVALNAGVMANVRINFCPLYSGQQNIQARIITDGPDTILVPITASGATPGLLETEDSVHFGVAVIGHPINKTLTIRNTGQMSVTITDATISGSAGSYYTHDMTMPITIEGGDSVVSTFIFNPLLEGDQNASLMLTTSDGGTLIVTLSGRATLHAYTVAPSSLFETAIISPDATTHEAVYINNYMDFPKGITDYRITGPNANVYDISYPAAWPLNIPAFGNDSIVVTFTPTEINKTYNGRLAIYGNENDSVIITLHGSSNATDVRQLNGLPQSFSLGQNYPNPFSDATEISYSIPVQSVLALTIFDQLGRKVTDLISGAHEAGSYIVRFNAANLPSGIYYYELRTDRYINDKIMRLVR
jgi:hypothetical protein